MTKYVADAQSVFGNGWEERLRGAVFKTFAHCVQKFFDQLPTAEISGEFDSEGVHTVTVSGDGVGIDIWMEGDYDDEGAIERIVIRMFCEERKDEGKDK